MIITQKAAQKFLLLHGVFSLAPGRANLGARLHGYAPLVEKLITSARLARNGSVIYESTISSLKRFKDDAREVAAGYECGIGIEGYNDIKEGDLIQAFEIEEIAR